MKARIPENEEQRLAALREYRILDTAAEQAYDDLTALAAYVCEVPIAMISLVDESRQWFKSKVGITVRETARDISFCTHTILSDQVMVVGDAAKDDRFRHSPMAVGSCRIRFYAGAPLITPDGLRIGDVGAGDDVGGGNIHFSVQGLSRGGRALGRWCILSHGLPPLWDRDGPGVAGLTLALLVDVTRAQGRAFRENRPEQAASAPVFSGKRRRQEKPMNARNARTPNTGPMIAYGALSAGIGVALGAFAAHALRELLSPEAAVVFDTGVRYQMYHSLALLATGLAGRFWGNERPAAFVNAARLFGAGIVLFSGSLYVLSLSGLAWVGAITPVGGLCFIAGWFTLFVTVIKRCRNT